MNNEKGFTLIEMMIVLLVISVLLIVTIPNITKHNSTINEKGCDAFVKMVEAQVQAYQIEHGVTPTSMGDLRNKGYLSPEQDSCPNGDTITIGADGIVFIQGKDVPDAGE